MGASVGSLRAAAGRAVARVLRWRFPQVRTLSVDALRAWLDAPEPGPVLLDVRQPEEFAVSHLPGAHCTPDVGRASEVLAGVPRDAPVVAYCSVGWRSAKLAAALRGCGFRDVRNLEGSIFAWANRGLPLVRDGRPVAAVHPYDALWGLLLAPRLRARRPGPDA